MGEWVEPDPKQTAYGAAPGPPERDVGCRDLRALVESLRQVVEGLARCAPEPGDGAAWFNYDEAMLGLYGALVALGANERDGPAR